MAAARRATTPWHRWSVTTIAVVAASVIAVDAPAASSAEPAAAPSAVMPAAVAGAGAPTTPPALICGNSSILDGPSTKPAGAVQIAAGHNGTYFNDSLSPNTTYWFAPGVHYIDNDEFSQIDPADGDTFIGAPGAIIDGNGVAATAFGGNASDVTIKYLTIRNFVTSQDQGTINHDMGTGWTVTNITATHNDGAAVMVGPDGVLKDSCLTGNGQYGFQGAAQEHDSNIVVDHNEISDNNTNNTEALSPDCGCSGGSKFWDVHGAVVTNNYVHDNMGAGLWADTNNTGFQIQGNYISHNDGEGIEYEISYNALIKNNTFIGNGWVAGPKNPGFPTGAIYLSESGSDSRVPGNYGDTLQIVGNVFTDNFSGVVAWENADRFCGSPSNTSSGYCTLVNPGTITESSCPPNITKTPYINDCRWKTQNVQVHDNVFNLTPGNVPNCTVQNTCGWQGVFSNQGQNAPYDGDFVQQNITFHQNNKWFDNVYNGPWHFTALDQGEDFSFATWQSDYGQDAGSTYDGTPPSAVQTALALVRSRTRVTYGHAVTLTARLHTPSGLNLPGRSVAFYHRAHGTTAWRLLASRTTDGSGLAVLTTKPGRNQDYVAKFRGETPYSATTGPVRTVTVRPRVSSHLWKSTVRRGATDYVLGTVSPNLHGRSVTLQRYDAGRWHKVTAHRLNSHSGFRFTVRWSTTGRHYYRVVITRVPGYVTGIGGRLRLTVVR